MQEELSKNMQQAREQLQKQGQQRLSRQQQQAVSEQFAKLAREQQLIRQAMQELNRLENKDGRNRLGNLEEMVKEMEQTEKDLVNKRIVRETIERQQQILNKLLDAEKAEREQEQEQKRESQEGRMQSPDYSIILQEFKQAKQTETEYLRTVPAELNTYYKIKVGDYFKNLNTGYNDQSNRVFR